MLDAAGNEAKSQYTSTANGSAYVWGLMSGLSSPYSAISAITAAGQIYNKPYIFTSNKLNQKTEKGLMLVDSLYNNVAYYDEDGRHRRVANEISIFDIPMFDQSLGEGFGGVAKFVHAFDDYLIYDDTKVVYHVHWERIGNYKNGRLVGNPSYENITSEVVAKLPNFGGKLLRGYLDDDPKTNTVSNPSYVRNPVR